MSRIRHRHRKRSTAGEKPEVGRKHGGAASVHMRGEGIKAALRPDRKSRRKRSFGGVIARAGGGSAVDASDLPDFGSGPLTAQEQIEAHERRDPNYYVPKSFIDIPGWLRRAAAMSDMEEQRARGIPDTSVKRTKGGKVKLRASGGELGEILDTSEPSAPTPVAAAPEVIDADTIGPGSGVVPAQNWGDMTLGEIGSALMKHARDTGAEIGSPGDWTPRQIGMAALKAAMLPGYEAAKLGAYARDSISPTVRDAIDNLPDTLRNARDTVGNWRDEAARELQARSAKEKADQEKNAPVSLQDYAERLAATIPGLNRIRAALSPKSNYDELAKTALSRHVPGDDALSHMALAPDPEPSPPFWRAALVHGSSDRARGGKVKRRDDGGQIPVRRPTQTELDQTLSDLNSGKLKPVPMPTVTGNDTGDRMGVVNQDAQGRMLSGPMKGLIPRASGGRTQKKWIQGAISHPGRMKKGAERAGMSTHEYMEKHKGDSGSLGSAARLGLRLSSASKGKKDL